MWFTVLGPLEVTAEDRTVHLSALKQRRMLAALLCRPRQPVGREDLADVLWPDGRPAAAYDNIRSYAHQLRRALGDGQRLRRADAGYLIQAEPAELDASLFDTLALRGSAKLAANCAEEASGLLHEALDLWRGPAFANLTDAALIAEEASRLQERRLAVLEDRIDADLALGRHALVCAELPALVTANPMRERLHGQLMIAMYRSGRQADALKAYQRARVLLISELGIEPGPALARLQQAILNADPSLDGPEGAAVLGRAAPVVPAQLPRDVSHFTGRASQLRRLDVLGGTASGSPPAGGVIVITGTPGVGKTALAVHWAHQ